MTYADIRKSVQDHFQGAVQKFADRIADGGPLEAADVSAYHNTMSLLDDALGKGGVYSLWADNDDGMVNRFIEEYGLEISRDSQDFRLLEKELKKGWRDYCAHVLAHNQSLEKYSYTVEQQKGEVAPNAPLERAGFTLREVWDGYFQENVRGDQWVEKTRHEKTEHVAVLFEVLGAETDIREVSARKAREVKDILLKYPRNRNKNPKTRGLPLAEALVVPAVAKLNVQTVNKYLATYAGLFLWANRQGYIDDAVFSGFAIRQNRQQGKAARGAFSESDVAILMRHLVTNPDGLIRKEFQKWGPLIGLFSGARLNEIAQIHLHDIRQEGGIWVFDLNDEEGKHLKNAASRRLVPMHSRLVELGLLEYVDVLRSQGEKKLFPSFSYCPKNGWGRALGRWFNDAFLVKLGMKDQSLVFHSLRHTVITALLQRDVPDPVVKALVGHAQEGVTQQHYFREGYTLAQLKGSLEKLPWALSRD